jgi:hypothetical protein
VVTRQEVELRFDPVLQLQFIGDDRIRVTYGSKDQGKAPAANDPMADPMPKHRGTVSRGKQLQLF